MRLYATHEKVIAVSLEFQRIARTQTHPKANFAWHGDSSSAKDSGLLFHWRAIASHFLHVVGPCSKNNKLNHRLSGKNRRGVCRVAVAKAYQSGA